MSDTSFLSPSSLMNDFLFMKDAVFPESDPSVDLSFDALSSNIDNEDLQSLTNCLPELRLPMTYQDSEISVTNSECSDDVDINLDDALLQNCSNTALLSSAVVSSNQSTGSLPSDLLDVDLTDSIDVDIWELLTASKNSSVSDLHSETIDNLLSSKVHWNNLSRKEQGQLVKDLSTAVSSQLGLREQLELIQIISPECCSSCSDIQSVIELSCLDDEKLQKVFTFLSNHTNNSSYHDDNNTFESKQHIHGHKLKHKTDRSERGLHDGSEYLSDSNTSCGKARKRSHKQLANRLKSKTPYKKAQQQLKEQRSGLFIKEQIVAVESSEVGELDDVDILT